MLWEHLIHFSSSLPGCISTGKSGSAEINSLQYVDLYKAEFCTAEGRVYGIQKSFEKVICSSFSDWV